MAANYASKSRHTTRTKKWEKGPIGAPSCRSANTAADRHPMDTFIQQALRLHSPRELSVPSRRLAAVLAPIYCHEGEYGVLFTKRSETVLHHRGQISFPGGGYEPRDAS